MSDLERTLHAIAQLVLDATDFETVTVQLSITGTPSTNPNGPNRDSCNLIADSMASERSWIRR